MVFAAGFEHMGRQLDNWITGHYGEDQFLDEHSPSSDDDYPDDDETSEINLAAFEREQEYKRAKWLRQKQEEKQDGQEQV